MLKKIKKFWKFVWNDDSLLSWVIALVLAFLIVKFLIYPGLGLVLGTSYPVVDVVSCSMEHNEDGKTCSFSDLGFEEWWDTNKDWYLANEIEKQEFEEFIFKNGFNKGDIIFLVGEEAKDINIGDIIVFQSNSKHPIIHRVVDKWLEEGEYHFKTKGDNNQDSFEQLGETSINENRILGKAVFKIPLLGWIKLLPIELKNKIS